MGISRAVIDLADYVMDAARRRFGPHIRMCELGQQEIRNDTGLPYRVAKQYFESLGIHHTSIDIAGKWGALPLDLSKPLPLLDRSEQYHVVTDFGTIEHVNASQYWAFRNTHNLCITWGLMIHALPLVGTYAGHCRYRYTAEALTTLAKKAGYNVLISDIRIRSEARKLVCLVLEKTTDNIFITQPEFDVCISM